MSMIAHTSSLLAFRKLNATDPVLLFSTPLPRLTNIIDILIIKMASEMKTISEFLFMLCFFLCQCVTDCVAFKFYRFISFS